MKQIFITLLLLTSCSKDIIDNKKIEDTDQKIFDSANKYLENKKYEKAAEGFARIFTEFPSSKILKQSMLMEAKSYFLEKDYERTINAIDNFLYLYPADAKAEDMYYMKALTYYNRINDVQREQETTKKAKEEFENIINRFSDGKYIEDVKLKMNLVNDHLAGKEMAIARLYLSQNNLVAAASRFQYVISHYDRTNQVEEALYRLVEIYLSFGDLKQAKKQASLLGYNYPDSLWYKDAFELIRDNN